MVKKLETCDVTKHVADEFIMPLSRCAVFNPHPIMMRSLVTVQILGPAGRNTEVVARGKPIIALWRVGVTGLHNIPTVDVFLAVNA